MIVPIPYLYDLMDEQVIRQRSARPAARLPAAEPRVNDSEAAAPAASAADKERLPMTMRTDP
jgi:hypothetical protein